jgi:bidirectional [NiFe] hydrogenase diaphorase subunit
MAQSVEIIIDGVQCEGKVGEMVLDVARAHGFVIPTLCHHEGLNPYGACRLCLVEVLAGGPAGLHSSCTLPVGAGMELETQSESVVSARRAVVQLLLDRTPQVPFVQRLAASMGVEPRSDAESEERCVLCGRCVRACAQVGAYAIGFAGRGIHRRVTTPFQHTPKTCIACRACFHVCPTGAIESTLFSDRIRMALPDVPPWELETVPCSHCGKPAATRPAWNHIQQALVEGLQTADPLCPSCRRTEFLERLSSDFG